MERMIKDFLNAYLLSFGIIYTVKRWPLFMDYLCETLEPTFKKFNKGYHENHPDNSI